MIKYAPITIFVYNRAGHLSSTIEALKKNKFAKKSELFIYSDGPKNEEDRKKVWEVRDYIKTINGFKRVTITEREENLGLAESIITGVTDIVNKYGKIIVLEDDLITSPYFLKFMNDGLNMYSKENDVISIHGYFYPIKGKLPKIFFIRGADCLGWATWKRGWDLFEKNGAKLLQKLKKKQLTHKFDLEGTYPYTRMLAKQVQKKNDSWAIRWYASAFLHNKLTLYPGKTLVLHTGNDGSGTNFGKSHELDGVLSQQPIKIFKIPLKENKDVIKKFKKYMTVNYPRKWNGANFFRIMMKLKRNKLSKLHTIKNIVFKKIYTIYNPYGWFGNFATWEEAKKECTGYDSYIILEKVKNSLLKVKNGEAVYERDSVLLEEIEYSWPVLAGLMMAKKNNKLNIIDFGGSLGSTYFQNRIFLKELDEVKWNIIEQKQFVDCGRKYFESNSLKFFYDIDTCLEKNKPNTLLLSSVVQYLQEPYQFIDKILKYRFEYIIIDRIGFIKNKKDRLTIQKVPPRIYKASYPCWFFNEINILSSFKENYDLIADFSSEKGRVYNLDYVIAKWKGFLFKLRKN